MRDQSTSSPYKHLFFSSQNRFITDLLQIYYTEYHPQIINEAIKVRQQVSIQIMSIL